MITSVKIALWILAVAIVIFTIVFGILWSHHATVRYTRKVKPGQMYVVGKSIRRFSTRKMKPVSDTVRILDEQFILKLERLMLNTLSVLDEQQITAWPSGGTLLGLYRDKCLMPYDDDADIHTSYEHAHYLWSRSFALKMWKRGLEVFTFSSSTIKLATREGACVRVRAKGTLTPVMDIFFVQIGQEYVQKINSWNGSQLTMASREKWHYEDVFPLVPKVYDFGDGPCEIMIPNNPEAMLEVQYGKSMHTTDVYRHHLISHEFPFVVLGDFGVWKTHNFQK